MKILLVLLLIGPPAFAACDIVDGLMQSRPGAEWNLRGETYDGLEWIDRRQPKPTRAEVVIATTTCVSTKAARDSAKVTARQVINSETSTDRQKIDALILLMDLDN